MFALRLHEEDFLFRSSPPVTFIDTIVVYFSSDVASPAVLRTTQTLPNSSAFNVKNNSLDALTRRESFVCQRNVTRQNIKRRLLTHRILTARSQLLTQIFFFFHKNVHQSTARRYGVHVSVFKNQQFSYDSFIQQHVIVCSRVQQSMRVSGPFN